MTINIPIDIYMSFHWNEPISNNEREQIVEEMNRRYGENNWLFCCQETGVTLINSRPETHDYSSDEELTLEQIRDIQLFRRNDNNQRRLINYLKNNSSQEKPHNDTCPICLEEMIANHTPTTVLLCRHQYHTQCLNAWAINCFTNNREVTCTNCRVEI